MKKIATHNSATGEKGRGIISKLFFMFSKCQKKTIKEQYEFGCRYFDIRCKKYKNEWACAHGLWKSKKSLTEIITELEFMPEKVYIMLTYEGSCNSDIIIKKAKEINRDCKNIIITTVNIKKPKWKCAKNITSVPVIGRFKCLNGKSWHTLIPIPWLWKKIYYNKPKFRDDIFTMVDFL